MKQRIRDILQESISQRAYHFTCNAYDIIKENRLHASSAIGSLADMDRNKHRFYFVSLTRSGIDGYNSGTQKIVLSGEKLNQKYKGSPVDYWAWSRDTKDKQGTLTIMRSGMEKEDRMFLDQPFIDNIRKYIIEIHDCLGGYDGKYREVDLHKSAMLKSICDQCNIPIFLYLTRDDFLKEKKSARINLEDIPEYQSKLAKGKTEREEQERDTREFNTPEREQYNMESKLGSLIVLLSFNDSEIESKIKKTLFGLDLNDPWPERIEREAKKDHEYYLDDNQLTLEFRKSDYFNSLSADIHNIRTHRDDATVFVLELIRKDMKKFKARSLSEYIEKKTGIYEYWEEHRRKYNHK